MTSAFASDAETVVMLPYDETPSLSDSTPSTGCAPMMVVVWRSETGQDVVKGTERGGNRKQPIDFRLGNLRKERWPLGSGSCSTTEGTVVDEKYFGTVLPGHKVKFLQLWIELDG